MNTQSVFHIGVNTYKEVVRDKIYYVFFLFSIFIIFFSSILGRLSIGESRVVIMDFSFFSMEFTGVMISIFVGITLVYREIEKKTIFNILSKPISRSEFILGKFLGLLMALVLIETVMFVVVVIFLKFNHVDVSCWILVVFGSILLQIMMILSCAVLFSAVSSPIVSGMFTLCFYIIGSISYQIVRLYPARDGAYILKALYALIPNFSKFDFSYQYVHHLDIVGMSVFTAWGYGISYVVLLLLIASRCFAVKDIF
ncbi:ABC transporter permease [Desulfoluna spongiiphila]|uniref:ABC-2 family transporter protein n=1 Tax=Desulfoluna spongiiphila TaxID=419481 RepID=A0A1G5JCW1_9BACT|nr:ABC transporter permease subunit [Desulfoluna spongiiphila]SCY86206.1 ABC-2 family transporter protein [Desulfoluna spongiiphila]